MTRDRLAEDRPPIRSLTEFEREAKLKSELSRLRRGERKSHPDAAMVYWGGTLCLSAAVLIGVLAPVHEYSGAICILLMTGGVSLVVKAKTLCAHRWFYPENHDRGAVRVCLDCEKEEAWPTA